MHLRPRFPGSAFLIFHSHFYSIIQLCQILQAKIYKNLPVSNFSVHRSRVLHYLHNLQQRRLSYVAYAVAVPDTAIQPAEKQHLSCAGLTRPAGISSGSSGCLGSQEPHPGRLICSGRRDPSPGRLICSGRWDPPKGSSGPINSRGTASFPAPQNQNRRNRSFFLILT